VSEAVADDAVTATDTAALKRTPLHALHVELGGKMVPFAGYDMPVQYRAGILKEHLHCRAAAALFDVSHMGQVELRGPGARAAAEALMPGDLQGLAPGRMRYTMLTNDGGGIVDDLMATRPADDPDGAAEERLFLVLNASRKEVDTAVIEAGLPAGVALHRLDDRALLALQGPQAAAVLARHCPAAADLKFMASTPAAIDGIDAIVFRSGYTGEDGYEISVADSDAEALARLLLAAEEVEPAGLGARDSLRLEAGLCLYGHDIDEETTPVETGLTWTIGKRRRAEGGFPGAETILKQIDKGPAKKRVGLRPEGRAPAREGAQITTPDGTPVGTVTSGGFGPSVGGPVAMGYVDTAHAAPGTALALVVRGKPLAATVVDMPFVVKGWRA
jgi:aminomethyltransferase